MLKKIEKTDEDGNVIICTVDENGLEQGPAEIHFLNGHVGQGTLKDGKLHGPYEEYYENGQLYMKHNCKFGHAEGPYEIYYENGKLREKGTRRDGRYDGLCEEYYENGQLKERCVFKDGESNGIYERYYENGQLNWKCPFKLGKEDGIYEAYRRDGHPLAKYNLKNGKKDGPCEKYNEDTLSWEKIIFRNDRALSGEEAEDYLREWQEEQDKIKEEAAQAKQRSIEDEARSEIIGGLKGKLEMLTDPTFRKPVGPARTPERQKKAQEIVDMRRASAIFKDAVKKAQNEGDEKTLQKIIDLAKPFEKPWTDVQKKVFERGAARRAARAKKDRD